MSTVSRRRKNLMRKHPYCHWCGRKLVYFALKPHQTMPPDFATIDHMNSRLRYPDGRPLVGVQVVSCPGCNHDRNREEEQSVSKEVLWERSGRRPKMDNQQSKSNRVATDASLYGICQVPHCRRARGVRTVLVGDTPERPWDAAPAIREVRYELICPDHGVQDDTHPEHLCQEQWSDTWGTHRCYLPDGHTGIHWDGVNSEGDSF